MAFPTKSTAGDILYRNQVFRKSLPRRGIPLADPSAAPFGNIKISFSIYAHSIGDTLPIHFHNIPVESSISRIYVIVITADLLCGGIYEIKVFPIRRKSKAIGYTCIRDNFL